jgi:hypothetical protein
MPDTTHRQLEEITGVSKPTAARVMQQQERLRHERTSRHGQQGTSRKRKREGKDPDFEEALSQWFPVIIRRGVSSPILKSKSEELAMRLGYNNFKATNCLLSRWKCKFGMKFKKAHGEKGTADAVSAQQWKFTKLWNLLQKL